MHKTVLFYWLYVFLSSVLAVSGYYPPIMNTFRGVRSSLPFSDLQESVADPDDVTWRKRSNGHNDFTKMLSIHAVKHKNDIAFVERMFRIFDLNGDNVIERVEFKAVLQLLGIVSHNI
ncbi:hypothetical protein CHS0354_010351 [Potamilus streckersoni]|uniref:EF-hand domain-containing protein n=1 Tax=Potamilus streckersoni TaxID=2493646 RepID=A0AAE0TDZ6_9BIVA|nr:hypothetical protein CHS0354_010351 [Potamilus streckersoni]